MKTKIQAMQEDFRLRQEEFQKMRSEAPVLLKCPFCGLQPEYCSSYGTVEEKGLGKVLSGVWVGCNCGVKMGQYGWDSQENDSGDYGNFVQAAEAWNRRTE